MGRFLMALGILALAGAVLLRLLGMSEESFDALESLLELGFIALVVFLALKAREEEREKRRDKEKKEKKDDDDFIVG
ncbi:hypothetical protein [Crenobacter cavernae]|uniref:Uncharacterized protein n=1 Tax=Crenobacter cavernae TaxID=2290923 RepID=A0A345Y2P7_9NEIS|nr:hypothetical protein [Crenobacter cavernae]AXK38199.1 hypothetical protein DWG20_01425 [Crenobacter cavernae]